ncbi:hypothetical protein AB0E81_10005 [Streptomyces sp. NPDC033538]|uniref:hypothetical protein n=1 Tax=Streptomyces sp. NPDC033538 TaxID=3155367 RepID=UPI0034067941
MSRHHPTGDGEPDVHPAGKNAYGRTAALIALTTALLLTTTVCADAKKAGPQEKTFPSSGKKLNVRTNDNPTDLVPADIEDVRVTLWFHEGASLGGSDITWELKGDTLDLDTSCSDLADCDSRVPTVDLLAALGIEERPVFADEVADGVALTLFG